MTLKYFYFFWESIYFYAAETFTQNPSVKVIFTGYQNLGVRMFFWAVSSEQICRGFRLVSLVGGCLEPSLNHRRAIRRFIAPLHFNHLSVITPSLL